VTVADDPGPFFHGTRADLEAGDLLGPGFSSNVGERRQAHVVYFTATLDAATWGAELAAGEGSGRIYRVEPTGLFDHDPQPHRPEVPRQPDALLPHPRPAARGG
jgi:hypothetical protein